MTRFVLLASAWLTCCAISACGSNGGGHERPDGAAAVDAAVGTPDADPDGPDAVAGSLDAIAPDAAPPATLAVCPTGAPYATIGAAIDAAPPGSTLEICAGVYPERLTLTKPVRLIGTGGAGTTIIDAAGAGTAVIVAMTAGVELEGLTIRNGESPARGGGLRCVQSTLAIRSSVFEDNRALSGGGLSAAGCQIDITDTSFRRNEATDLGGGAYITGGGGTLTGGDLRENRAEKGGAFASSGNDYVISGAELVDNEATVRGGAIHYGGNGTIQNSRIEGNSALWIGGGVYLDANMPTLTGNEILHNTSENDGGGVYVHQGMATIVSNHFAYNASGDDGGGLRLFESASLVQDNLVERNRAADSGAGIRVSHVPAVFYDNIIVDNEAVGVGGGIDMDNDASVLRGGLIARNKASSGGGIHAWLFPWNGGVIEDVELIDNEAWRGGAMMIRHNFQPIALRGLTVRGNVAGHGAGIYLHTSRFTLSHSTFARNRSTNAGGALVIGGDGEPYFETMCPCPPTVATGTIDFVVAHGNQAASGGSGLWARSPDLTVRSSIFSANQAPAIIAVGPAATPDQVTPPAWRYNDVFPASFTGFPDPTGADGNLSVAPQFTNAGMNDFRLLPTSPCIDAGDPAFTDADASRADMGAFGGLGSMP